MGTITTQELLDRASAQTGLDDFGDLPFRDALDRLMDSASGEAKLSEAGAERFAGSIIGYLVNRLKIVDYLKKHPDLLEQPIEKPMFVFGLPRTGTTLTINMLASDPARRNYMRWEALSSVPPSKSSGYKDDERYLAEQQRIDMSQKYMPHLSAIHHEDADSPSEDQFAMAMSFCSQLFDSILDVPGYHKWFLHEADYEPAFRFQKMQLQLMQAENGGRWTLKNPWHPLYLDALTNVYPDAQLVMTHRDPLQVVGSACSLVNTVRPIYSDAVDGRRIADALMETFDLMIERQQAYRAKHGEDAIFDIDYAEQVRDPVGMMAKVYDHFNEPLTAEAEAAMRACIAENPKGKHGKHKYTLEEFGVSEDEVRERYKDYRDRFGFA
ncbi:sulfotransferase family protein [Sphingorhabdus sp. M41]|uniref:sulfotransferase family protein n=1 Tax=Sphingorhabdus sp. M41 TaxID=1806885 RepID=UPI000B0134C5|nr:sulfotransferase [Sphingorhabdus sp. M41]